MFRWKITAAAATAVAVAALALTGCTTTDDSTGGADEIVIGQFLAQATFDTTQAEWGNRALYYQAVYDTLLVGNPDGTITGSLASEYEYDETNTVLTLTIRDGVTFTDGTELTADIVVQNLERFKNGGGAYASDLANVDTIEADGSNVCLLYTSDAADE